MMKNIFAVICLVISVFTLQAQSMQTKQFNKEIKNLKSNKLVLESSFFDAKIKTWDKDFTKIEALVKINDANYLKNVVVDTENTNLAFKVWTKLEMGKIDKDVKNVNIEVNADITIYIPKNMEIEIITEYGDVDLSGIYKKYDVNCQFGDLDLEVNAKYLTEKNRLILNYGDATIAVDKKDDITFVLDNNFGDISTNLDLIYQRKNEYKLNNGDKTFEIESNFGDIELVHQ